MIPYTILTTVALITLPVIFVLSAKNKVSKTMPVIAVIGLFIALIATFIEENFSFYYTILAMFGLAFALSVLLDKRQERKIAAQEVPKEEVIAEVEEVSELQQFIKQQEQAAAVVEEDVVDESTDDDLEQWMSATITEPTINVDSVATLTDSDIIAPIEEESRGEK